MGKEKGGYTGESKWFLGKMNGALKEKMGGMIVCDKVCLDVVWTFSVLLSQFSLVDETPGEGIYDNWVPSGGSAFRQIRGVQRKPLPAFAVFWVPIAQSNQYTKAA